VRTGLIACCKEKLDHAAPAKELYQSDLFKKCMAWITKKGRVDEWGILSARHGLVQPGQVIKPYDVCLADLSSKKRQEWADMVHAQLVGAWGKDTIYMVLAGSHYRLALRNMPLVEDVIAHWTRQRRDNGMSGQRSAIGIGVLKRYLKEGKNYP
jgi:hypothetical protein